VGLFLLSRAIFQVPYDWLSLAEAIVIPVLVAFPIASFVFYQAERLANAKVALARQARDNKLQKLLIEELNHRIKNTLATVASIAVLTAREIADREVFLELFKARLIALAGAHDVLYRGEWSKVSLRELAAQILAPYGSRIQTEGPDLVLLPTAVLPLSMMLHELATNAAKYGALAANGTVAVKWTKDDELALEWKESGAPAIVEKPVQGGFGSRLIRHIVERELSGSVESEFRTEGFVCHVRVPTDRIHFAAAHEKVADGAAHR
jgi:two-component sensor histidine kinase